MGLIIELLTEMTLPFMLDLNLEEYKTGVATDTLRGASIRKYRQNSGQLIDGERNWVFMIASEPCV